MTKKKKILLTVLAILIILIAAVLGYGYYLYSGVLDSEVIIDETELSLNKALSDKVVNIALFGIDGRDDINVEGDRTDTIIIGTLDSRSNQVKVTSVMRDTFVKICPTADSESDTVYAGDQDGDVEILTEVPTETLVEEDGTLIIDSENTFREAHYDKINAAYSQGGAAATIKTLNENFDLNITDYITVNFQCLMDVVDALGGVQVNIPNETVMYWTNQYLKESNGYGERDDLEITELGPQTLTGAQALAFVRNRYSDSDYGRTQRQRELLEAIFNKVKSIDLPQALSILNSVYPYVKTSLSLSEITNYATLILNSNEETSFEQMRIPTNEYGLGGYANEVFYLFPATLVDNVVALHSFLYGDQLYNPSYTVRQISQVITEYYENNAYNLQPASEAAQETEESETDSSEYVEEENDSGSFESDYDTTYDKTDTGSGEEYSYSDEPEYEESSEPYQ